MLIQRLIEENIPFSVCVARTFLKAGAQYSGLDFFMIADKKHCKKLAKLKDEEYRYGFGRSHRADVLWHNMSRRDIEEFKGMQKDFKKALHCEWGRVYELR